MKEMVTFFYIKQISGEGYVITVKRNRTKYHNQQGFTLTYVLILMVLLLVYGLTVSSIAVSNLNTVKKTKYNASAYYTAESGVMRGISEIKTNRTWDGTTDGSGLEDKLKYKDVVMPGSFASYTVRVYNNFNGSAPISAPNGTLVPAGSCYILSDGKSIQNTHRYAAVMLGNESLFDYGLFSQQGVQCNGSISLTAYDSTTGNSVPQAAHIATNNAENGAITINGSSAYIDGSAIVGPGGDLAEDKAVVTHGHPTITGDPPRDALVKEKYLPPVEIPEGQPIQTFSGNKLPPGDYRAEGTLTIRNQDITLTGAPGGAIYIFDGIDGKSTGNLKVDTTNGPVKIYSTGEIFFAGRSGIVNTVLGPGGYPNPADIMLFVANDVDNVKLTGNGLFHCTMYAPGSTFDMSGNSDYYGSIVVNDFFIRGNPTFHYDVNLKDITDFASTVVTSWVYY